MSDEKKNLAQKLIEVRKSVPFLKKDNAGFQFKYVSSSQALGALRSAMDDNGVLLVPSVTRADVSDITTQKGKTHKFTELWFTFTWVNADDPTDTIECEWYGQGIDDGEKGVGKAATYSEKYFLLKFFNIPTDKDDPDGFQRKPVQEKSSPAPAAEKKDDGTLATPEQRKKIVSLLKDPHVSEALATKAADAESDLRLTADRASKCIAALVKAIADGGG